MGPGAAVRDALINIDLAAVGNWAERRGIAYTSYTDLSQKPEVYELIAQEVDAGEPEPGARGRGARAGRRSASSSSCTRSWTRTTRRSPAPARCGAGYIAQKYAALIEALYGERDRVSGGGEGDLRGRPHRHHAGGRA